MRVVNPCTPQLHAFCCNGVSLATTCPMILTLMRAASLAHGTIPSELRNLVVPNDRKRDREESMLNREILDKLRCSCHQACFPVRLVRSHGPTNAHGRIPRWIWRISGIDRRSLAPTDLSPHGVADAHPLRTGSQYREGVVALLAPMSPISNALLVAKHIIVLTWLARGRDCIPFRARCSPRISITW